MQLKNNTFLFTICIETLYFPSIQLYLIEHNDIKLTRITKERRDIKKDMNSLFFFTLDFFVEV